MPIFSAGVTCSKAHHFGALQPLVFEGVTNQNSRPSPSLSPPGFLEPPIWTWPQVGTARMFDGKLGSMVSKWVITLQPTAANLLLTSWDILTYQGS